MQLPPDAIDLDAIAVLDSSQLFMLQTAIKSIDSFFTLLSGQNANTDEPRFQRMDSINLNKTITRKHSISEQYNQTSGAISGSDAVLSVELMDTQEKYGISTLRCSNVIHRLRRAQLRLDVLELIHYQCAEDTLMTDDNSGSSLSFDEILACVKDVKMLVGGHGMEGRALGDMLRTAW